MANKIANRVKMTVASVASSGTGDITLGASVPGYLTFAEGGVSDADTVPYVLEAANGDWEIGKGTYTSSGTVLARTTVTKSSVGGVIGTSKITASSTTIVMISPLAADLQAGTAAGNLVQLDGNASIPVSNGGTGLSGPTGLPAGYIPYGNGTGAFSNSANFSYNGTSLFLTGTATDGIVLRSSAGAGSGFKLYNDSSVDTAYLMNYYSGPMVFGTANTERLRIASDGSVTWGNSGSGYLMSLTSGGNLGLGTSSPSTYANSYGPVLVVGTGNNFATIQGRTDGPSGASNGVAFGGSYSNNPINGSRIWFGAQGSSGQQGMIGFYVKNVNDNTTQPYEAMRLDASGNLGLGVTPSAWGSAYRTAFQNELASLTGLAGTSVMELSANFYLDNTGTGRYIATDYATQYQQLFGAHKWSTAASGSAGSAISFTQAMTLDASGNLLINTTSAFDSSARLNIQAPSGGNGGVIRAGTNGNYGLYFQNTSGTTVGGIAINSSDTAYNTSSDISLKENISDATSALSSILAMPIRQFDWKSGGHTDYGVVAQEADEYAPEIVTQGGIWSVDYGRITPRLIKAFQELAAKVSALEAKQ